MVEIRYSNPQNGFLAVSSRGLWLLLASNTFSSSSGMMPCSSIDTEGRIEDKHTELLYVLQTEFFLNYRGDLYNRLLETQTYQKKWSSQHLRQTSLSQ